ncbi:MAG: hypothetical protein IPK16_06545 [Anaerolineales bacterium]|nr:hypothetical protein [Anaerolineales bacterium]
MPDLAIPQDQWRAQYFNNTDLAGSPAAASYVSRGAYPLDKNWGSGSPAAGVGADYWSARFEGNFYFTPADYDFFAQSDDGVRVYIDNILIIDAWYDGYKQASNKFDRIGDGYHLMRVDYYERAGDGYVRVWWAYRGSSNPVQPSGNTSNDIPPPPPPPGPP